MFLGKKRNLRNQHRLIFVVGQHVDISTVRNGEDVGWHFRTTLATVQLGATEGVHGESLVGVDGHAEETRVRLSYIEIVSLSGNGQV